jgi:phage pi2 protein 07
MGVYYPEEYEKRRWNLIERGMRNYIFKDFEA